MQTQQTIRLPELPVHGADVFPQSFAQQRLWFMDQMEPGNAFYNAAVTITLQGRLDVDALRRTLTEIVRRHESLRTVFAEVEEQPVQEVLPPPEVELSLIDLSSLETDARAAEAERLTRDEAAGPFDLARGPLFRPRLLRLGDEEHVLILCMHHIVGDGWSLGVLFHELCALYAAFSRGEPSPLPELEAQYADFAVWQRDQLAGDGLRGQLEYWTRALAGAPAPAALPADRARPPRPSYRGAVHAFRLPPGVDDALRALSRAEGATLFMTLLAAWQALLHRYTGQDDLVVGTPIANRTEAETEGLIGFFVNMLALRADLSDDPTFRTLLGRVRQAARGAFAHQDLPFERLVEELAPERSLDRQPLFGVVFALQTAPWPPLQMPGLRLRMDAVDPGTARYDLTFTLREDDAGIGGRMEYAADLFDEASVRRLARHYGRLLQAVVSDPDARVRTLPLADGDDVRTAVELWNATARPYPRDASIPALFAEQVRNAPDSVAVVHGGERATYAQLDARVERLARRLRAAGAGRGTRVGVCVERGIGLAAAWLAVLRTGAAYLPLDRAHPRERLAWMLEDAEARLVVADAASAELVAFEGTDVLPADDADPADGDRSAWVDAAPEEVAYVVYTSGSTGRPKGTEVPHRGIVRLVRGADFAQLGPDDRVVQLANTGFDTAAWEVWGALLNGGTLVFHPVQAPTLEEVGAMLRAEAITSVWLTAGLFHQMVDEQLESLGGLRRIVAGGDVLSPPHVARVVERFPHLHLINGYGPTENSTFTTCHRLRPADLARPSVPIGRPIANSTVYVLDPAMRPVPPGVPGELYAGGDGVALGYLRRPRLTAERFVPDPFSGRPGARLYRTGDRVRVRECVSASVREWDEEEDSRESTNALTHSRTHALEFLGRMDQQVKIRGFRVEPGEIEAALRQHPGVADVTVIPREDEPGERRLVAYVVAREDDRGGRPGWAEPFADVHAGEDEDPARAAARALVPALRAHLRGRMPDYMVPAAFVVLDRLPLTPNGKVDRRALPAPDGERDALETAYVAPRTPLEASIAGIWADVLGVRQVGVHDRFFDLGGHSLLATRVVSRMRTALQVELPVRALFEAPTVAGLAAVVERAEHDATLRLLDELEDLDADELAGCWPRKQARMRDLETRLAALPPETRRLLELRLQREKREAASAPVRRGAQRAPLSFAQRRLWFMDRLEPGALYNSPLALRVHGALDAAALERALAEVVRRHESLRTVCRADGDAEAEQVVLPAGDFRLPGDDLAALDADRRAEEERRIVDDEIRRPFDLAEGPVFRARLIRLAQDEHVLVLAMHHVVSDGWSLGVLFRELGALYEAFARGAPAPLEPLPLQYADYAAWQREHWTEERLAAQLEWWTRTLDGAPAVLELPADRPRPAVQSHRGARLRVTLPHALAEGVRELARRQGATPFMVMLAAFHVLLWRWSGEEDLVVGSPVAGRTQAETEGLIGIFVNTLPLRADLSGDPPFAALLQRVREATLGAYQHQDLPFERLVEALHPGRSLSHAPVFQTMFALQNATPAELRLPGVTMEILPVDPGTARLDLEWLFRECEDGITGSITYAADLFDAATVERMAGHYHRLLDAAVAGPDTRVSALPLLDQAERDRVLREWNRTARPEWEDACIHQLFERQAARTPDAAAVLDGETVVTYAELDARAERLARRLRALGVGPEVRVGVHLERTAELMVSLLAVLKAGGAYLPLDPAYPAERLALMMEDANAALVLTLPHLRAALPPTGARVVVPDALGDDAPAADALPAPDPANLAYIIYTSGSTGRPKGIQVEHRSAVVFLRWGAEAFTPRELAGMLACTSICFDPSVLESFLPLAVGGTVVMARDALALPDLPRRDAVTFVHTVPSAATELVRAGAIPPSVCAVGLVGEPLPRALADALYDTGTVQRVHNLYGPSEDTVYTTWGVVERGPAPVTIGGPIHGARAYVLDAWMQPVPVGVRGELYVGGQGVSRGYLGRPGLTAERYVPDPFAAEPGARLYRTGDRVRWTAAGELGFFGRLDHQVKVRGFRVEPGEIEAALRRHPGVAEAVAAVVGEGGARRLAAWVLPPPGEAAPDAEALKAHLRGTLPDFMVPQVFVFPDRFPRTPSGKVDRRALPVPDAAAETAAYVEPRTAAERTVAEVFAQVLGVERVGAADDFFDLGGHSLLAMHVWTHLRDRGGAALPLRALFENSTVAALATALEAALQAAPDGDAADAGVAITARPRDGMTEVEAGGERVTAYAAPVSFSQHRLWMLDRMDPGRAAYAVPLALRLRGALDREALQRALDALAERHESLRTVFRWMDGGAMQVVLPRGALPMELMDLSSSAGDAWRGQGTGYRLQPATAPIPGLAEAAGCNLSPVTCNLSPETELRRRLADEAARPFDLEHGPLARASLYALGADEHVLLLNLHHVITDGWSTGVLLRDLAALYGAFSRGEPSPLAPPALQYADYAAWQRERLAGAVYGEQLAYWKGVLAGAPALLELPADRPRPAVWDGRGAMERFHLPREAADAVEALARAEGCTPFMVLLAVFQALLGRYARQDDLVIGTPVANRARPETRDVVGFFVNTLALRADLSGDPTFRALLHRVREGAMGAFAHQEMPFERLVDELKVPRSAAHSPVFQVMFSLQTANDGSASLPGVEAERVPVEGTHALFDLTLALRPRPEGMEGALEYATALFDRETALRLIEHFRTLLAAACAAPDARVSALPLLPDDGVETALRAWEGPPLESTFALSHSRTFALVPIHARIAVQAARTPNAVAVEGGGRWMTYAELEDQATRLAHRLHALGVRPGAIAAVRAERSVEAVVAVLAVLKAGGAYLPLDPAYPAERQAYMLADSGAGLLLDATGAGAPEGYAGRVAELAAELAAAAESPPETPPAIPDSLFPVPCSPDDLAYVIYTSGSTGRPKGVAVPHRALGSYVDAARQAYALTPDDRFLQFAPLSFDSSVEELFAPLAAGATMVLRDEEMLASVDGFWRACARLSPTIASLPTAFWHELAAAMDRAAPAVPPALRVMIIGGERALPERVAQWRRGVGDGVRLINSYGPTETTVAATLHEVRADEPVVPIGQPMPGYRVRVLDESLRPVPAGVPGELFVGGIGVARGYLGRPDVTAERFVPDPFAAHPGERLYATGDLVRWRPDGTLCFLGRADDQVKVRGFRIEPGEIESLLRRQPGVRDAVVAVREDEPGDRRLAAYLVPGDGSMSMDAIRAALRAELPAYMVPSAFVALDALPMTPSGKVDRRALPAPKAQAAAPAAPLSRREREVAEVWRGVLGADAIGPEDNFFDLGGNSLLLIRLAARLQEELGVTLTAVELFRFPTVRALAAHLSGGDAADAPGTGRDERLRQGTSRLRNLRRGAPV